MIKYLIVILFIVGLAGGGYFVFKNNSNKIVAINSTSEQATTTTENKNITTNNVTTTVNNIATTTKKTNVTPAPTKATTPTYTIAQVAVHNNTSSCWTIVNGTVFDITSYVPNHPGGDKILKACGKDGTSLFGSVREHAAQNAGATLSAYSIGKLMN